MSFFIFMFHFANLLFALEYYVVFVKHQTFYVPTPKNKMKMVNKLYSFIVICHYYCKIKLFYTSKNKKGIHMLCLVVYLL